MWKRLSFVLHRIYVPAISTVVIAGVIILLTSASNAGVLVEEAPAEVAHAAERGLLPFLKAIPSAELSHFNLSDQNSLEKATLGDPFRVYTITPEKILNYERGTNVTEIISPTFAWLFPVVLENKARTLLTVDLMNGKWKAVAIGSSNLAKQMTAIKEEWPSSQGYEHVFVRVFQAKSDFVLLQHADKMEMTPLTPGTAYLDLEPDKMYEASDVILRLKEPVLKNMTTFGNK